MTDQPLTVLTARPDRGSDLFFSLVSGGFRPGKSWDKGIFRAKFLCRSCFHPVLTLKWLDRIASDPLIAGLLKVQDRLPGKIHRPYLAVQFSAAERFRAINAHYTWVEQLQNADLRQALSTRDSTLMCSFSGKEGDAYSITLGGGVKFDKEGEATLSLLREGTALARITFSVVDYAQQKTLFIGGLQGADSHIPHELIRQATKSCYGLFPKRLLLEALQLIFTANGITRILAVSDKGHIHQSARYQRKKRGVFLASYSEFWQSIGAEPETPLLFALPLRLERKPESEIASKKRAEYRRRYDLLDRLQAGLLC